MSLGANDLTMLGMGAALGAAVTAITCALSSKSTGTAGSVQLPTATKGMAAAKGEPRAPKYHAGVVKVKDGMFDQYTSLHDHTWDQVMAKMHEVLVYSVQRVATLQAAAPTPSPLATRRLHFSVSLCP